MNPDNEDKEQKKHVEVPLDMGDVVHDVVFFVIATAGAFAWALVMLLIISFVTLGYLHFDIKWMLLIALVFSVVVAVLYIRSMHKKYKGSRVFRTKRK